ncbi:MAG: YkgJ family cysteine cluster protein [Spirochaetes bacterium]|nr:YkgJ family cysteine cluster protein [Spirochaetota bacterium]
MNCRPGCGACCIEISISSQIPGMPSGKKAGERCIHLNSNMTCSLHGTESYPDVCRNLTPQKEMCGDSSEDAMRYLKRLENLTKPD